MDRSKHWVTEVVVLAGISFLLGGCASGPSAKPSIANADMGIQRAREANAINHAPLELRLAEEKIAQARKAADDDKNEEARQLADEALADAQTAEAKSRATQMAQIEQQARQGAHTLRQETALPPPPTPMGR